MASINVIQQYLVSTVRQYEPTASEEHCLQVAWSIIQPNFPICLSKSYRTQTKEATE